MKDKLFISLKSNMLNMKLNFFLNEQSWANMINPQNIYNASILPLFSGSHILAFSKEPNISLNYS